MILIDKYAYTNNLKDIRPSAKAIVGLTLLILSMILTSKTLLIGIILLMSFVLIVLAKIDFKNYVALLKIPISFLIIGVCINLINVGFENQNMIYSIKLFDMYIGTSIESINISLYILIRSMSCLSCVYFIVLTTPFNDILILLKKMRLPNTAIELSMLIYRFIFIFLEEVSEIKKSQQLKFGYINLRTSYKSLGMLGSILFKRMVMRYEELSISLDV
ncbi:MAG: cobalt ECF transporter T component CbiQ, partial [Romboutsia sp.]|uniref:cobalt ECF transporter T component CbiQ n=1 Tax=Romboutsia sp. TaxID=1965302 RepID=UPI003F2E4BCF